MCSSAETEFCDPAVPEVVESCYGLYPGFEAFSGDYNAEDYGSWIEQSNGDPLPAPLALYIQDLCRGNSPPVRGGDIFSSRCLRAIEQELALQGALFDSDRSLKQFILSGSVATGWSEDQLHRLVSVIRDTFTVNQTGIANWCACLGTVLPSPARLRLLRILGFSSLRFAYSDHAHAQRVLEKLGMAMHQARHLGVHQLVLDLIFDSSRSHTSVEALEAFLRESRPDRVRLVCANTSRHQSMTRLLSLCGYETIGLDWFLHSDDIWLQARASGLLRWSPLGYTDMANPDVIGVGPGAISSVGEFYAANSCRWETYEALVMQGKLPVVRGIELEADDVLRREIMGMILSSSCIWVTAVEEKWGIQFEKFFADEVEYLRDFEQKNWLEWREDRIQICVLGSCELTELCRLFDNRMRRPMSQPTLSFV